MSYDPSPDRLSEVLSAAGRQLAQALEEAAQRLRESAKPPAPAEPEIGSVIRWQRTYNQGGRTYDWAAIRTSVGWFTTRRTGLNAKSTPLAWPDILDLAGGATIRKAVGWFPLLPIRASAFYGDDEDSAVDVSDER